MEHLHLQCSQYMGVWEESGQNLIQILQDCYLINVKKVNWLRTNLCFGLLKFCLLCLRDSRSVNRNIIKIDNNKLALTN